MTSGGNRGLGPGGEFDLIRMLTGASDRLPAGVLLGPGDDCAVLEGGVVVSVDLSVEGIHFRRDWLTLEEAGYRATAGALSDLAGMGAQPLGILLSMGIAAEEARPVAKALQAGAQEACAREQIQVLGGDLSRSPGPIVLDVTVLGRSEVPLLRRGSQPGDRIWVTGFLGGTAAALRSLSEGRTPTSGLRARLARPLPRIQEMLWLRERVDLHAGIDLSDGLAGDAGHLAAAGEVALILEAKKIPVDLEMTAAVPDLNERLRLALEGGEDYEVCFTAPPGGVGALADEFQAVFGIPLTSVGRVEAGEGVQLEHPDGTRHDVGGGFDHFREKEAG